MGFLEDFIKGLNPGIKRGEKLGAKGYSDQRKLDALKASDAKKDKIADAKAKVAARKEKKKDDQRTEKLERADKKDVSTETSKLQKEFSSRTKNAAVKIAGLKSLKVFLSNSSGLTAGQLRTGIARIREVGMLTDKDIQRAVPNTLRQLFSTAGVFVGVPNFMKPFNPEELKIIDDSMGLMVEEFTGTINTVAREFQMVAPERLPTLHRLGLLDKVMSAVTGATHIKPKDFNIGGLSVENAHKLNTDGSAPPAKKTLDNYFKPQPVQNSLGGQSAQPPQPPQAPQAPGLQSFMGGQPQQAPVPNASQPMAASPTVKMKHPTDGTVRAIPREKAEEATTRGYTLTE